MRRTRQTGLSPITLIFKSVHYEPFIWITAHILSLPFLGDAVFTAYDVLGRQDIINNPESKVAVGWLFTGLIFLATPPWVNQIRL